MELVFLAILILFMVLALFAGFPVAFSLPGSAILSIGLAALTGWLFAGDVSAYFAQGGPVEWLSAGVTNFRSLYWDVERDTLIAVPLFVFMGIMFQRSRIAEDLLVTMAQLFGPVPGGLGISVVFVGALLAATTGIVGATVIAMGLISLPAMLRNNYSKPLATGTICASGTLGQIIPPSVVLIILADQLSAAADQASSERKALYKETTGEFVMPSQFDVTSASAGDMFMGAFIPGLVLVGLYMAYILIRALIQPRTAPPVRHEGQFDRQFALKVALALVPPLTLIFAVLGSILLGIATVNQAGSIGAIGATIMAGYRLAAGRPGAFYPSILALVSLIALTIILSLFDINIKNIETRMDVVAVILAGIAVAGLLVAILWSIWRTYVIEDMLRGVMLETAKTTSMVFIILIGAAMLTSAFRGFGGEELVREFLTGLPGGFWGQFITVMVVIFLLGFFLDFIEIAVVVVPIVAPILLADPSANITAVWFGVMVGINIQTSFLTPPFGFALFYLRGVAPPSVRTMHIYRGAAAFIALQLAGLAIAGAYPSLINYLPFRTYLTSEVAPPPVNPRLQACLEEYVFAYYDEHEEELRAEIAKVRALDLAVLPEAQRERLEDSLDRALTTFELVEEVRAAERALADYVPEYKPLHREVRNAQAKIRKLEAELAEFEQTRRRLTYADTDVAERLARVEDEIAKVRAEKSRLEESIPAEWEGARARYKELANAVKRARGAYRSNVDRAYETLTEIRTQMEQADALAALGERLAALEGALAGLPPEQAMESVQAVQRAFDELDGVGDITSSLRNARRALRGEAPDRDEAAAHVDEARELHATEVTWRRRAAEQIGPELAAYDEAIRSSIGLRLQERFTTEQAEAIAACRAQHRDISLHF